MKWRLFSLLLAVVIFGCDRSYTSNGVSGGENPTGAISIDNFSFSPASLTVAAGQRVTWTNHDDVPHTVTSSSGGKPLSSPALDTDGTYSFEFKTAGTY